jgi:hypothetical protein
VGAPGNDGPPGKKGEPGMVGSAVRRLCDWASNCNMNIYRV